MVHLNVQPLRRTQAPRHRRLTSAGTEAVAATLVVGSDAAISEAIATAALVSLLMRRDVSADREHATSRGMSSC